MAEAQGSGEDFTAAAAALGVAARVGTLATLRLAEDGALSPHASLVTPAFDQDGTLLLLLSALSVHTRQLSKNPRCGLLLAGEAPDGAAAGRNPQLIPRLSLEGEAALLPRDAAAAAQARYLRRHPYAAGYAGFADFGFWRVEPTGAWYVGGFGAAARLDVAALKRQVAERLAAVDAEAPPA